MWFEMSVFKVAFRLMCILEMATAEMFSLDMSRSDDDCRLIKNDNSKDCHRSLQTCNILQLFSYSC